MARLGDYIREFAELLGNRQDIRFAGVVKGSAVLRATVSENAVTEVTKRLLGARSGDAPKDALDRADKIDRMMREDHAYGEILHRDGNVVYAFEGGKRKGPELPDVLVSQEGELTGVVTRIGGRDATVPLLLADSDGVFHQINVKEREQAREIAAHLYGSPIRVFGSGTWKRSADGTWKLFSFTVQSFQELDDRPLTDVLNEIRTIPENGWAVIDDPLAEWERLRSG
jgi:hypothetical protein